MIVFITIIITVQLANLVTNINMRSTYKNKTLFTCYEERVKYEFTHCTNGNKDSKFYNIDFKPTNPTQAS